MKVRVLGAFDIETQSYRPGQIVEMGDELAANLARRALVLPVPEPPQDPVAAPPRKPDARRKS